MGGGGRSHQPPGLLCEEQRAGKSLRLASEALGGHEKR